MKRRWMFLLLTLLITGTGVAQEPLVFDDAAQEARYLVLTKEFRCLVCQNQNLADSDAPLAHDLRKEIYGMLQSGSTDDQIRSFLVDRYGDFVLYRPPVKANTVALWALPLLLLCVGTVIVLIAVRRQKRQPASEETEREA